MSDKLTDGALVEAIPYLNRYALMLTKNKFDADDLVSLTMVRSLEIIRNETVFIQKPKAWLSKIMWFQFLSNFIRKNKVQTGECQFIDYMGSVPSGGTTVDINNIFQKRNQRDRSVIIGHIKGHTAKSMAEAMSGYRTGRSTILKTISNFKHDVDSLRITA